MSAQVYLHSTTAIATVVQMQSLMQIALNDLNWKGFLSHYMLIVPVFGEVGTGKSGVQGHSFYVISYRPHKDG